MDTNFAQRRRRDLIVAGCLALIAALVPLFVKDVYVQNIMVLTLMYAALSQSWNILSGYCGQISLGHALYFGLGAYTTALLFTKFGVLPWFGMLGGGLISAVIAMALGYPCFRLRGHYFVIATIVIAETALLLFQNWDWAGAALGIDIPVRRDSWLTFQFTRSKLPYFYFALALACVAWLVTWWLEDSKWGYWWRAVKDNPDAAESLGVVVFNSKMGAAAVSAFLTAVGGSFYAQFVSYIDPESVMGFQFSLLMALPAVLGGIGTLWGPVLGAVILIPLTELTRSFIGGSGRGVDLIVYGTLIVLISLARPEGLVGLFSRRRKEAADDGAAGNPRRLAAFRRPDRQQRYLDFGRTRRDRRTDRPQRRRQVDAVQPDRGRAAANSGIDHLRRRGRHRAAGGGALPARHRAHLPGREKLRDHDGDRQRHRRRAGPHHRDARGPAQGP
jgi:branched-chain amino acid transport system permease protein